MGFRRVRTIYLMSPCDLIIDHCHSLQRNETRRFNDSDLAAILQNATEWSAGAFRARGTPAVLRFVEVLGINQARRWGTCSVRLPGTHHCPEITDNSCHS